LKEELQNLKEYATYPISFIVTKPLNGWKEMKKEEEKE
jgi:hypothetical protein